RGVFRGTPAARPLASPRNLRVEWFVRAGFTPWPRSQALPKDSSMRLGTTFLAVLLALPAMAHAQATSLKGKFVDTTNRPPVPGVQVKLTNFADTADVRKLAARDDGRFEATGL